MAKYPNAQGPATVDSLSSRPAVGSHQSDPVWKWPSTGKVSPPNPTELQSTREGVGTAARGLRSSHESRGNLMPAGSDGIRGCKTLGEIARSPTTKYGPRT